MKRLWFFGLVLCLCLIVSCSEAENGSVQINFTDYETDSLGGYDFRFCTDMLGTQTTYLGMDESTLFCDMAMQRVADVETELDCTISACNLDFVSLLKYSVMSGIDFCDASMNTRLYTDGTVHHLCSTDSIRSGYLSPLLEFNDSGILDITDSRKWGNANHYGALAYNNDIYGLFPYAWPEYSIRLPDYIICVNEQYVKALGQNDPRETVEKGLWDRDAFVSLIQTMTFTDNASNEVKGISFYRSHFHAMAFRASRVEFAVEAPGEGWIAGYQTEAGREALEWATDVYFNQCKDCMVPIDDTYRATEMFINGEVSMNLTHNFIAFGTADGDRGNVSVTYHCDDYGILPFPLSPGLEYGKWAAEFGDMIAVVIPASNINPDCAVMVLNALFDPFEGFEDKDSVLSYYDQYMFLDHRDAEVVYSMMENVRYSFYGYGGRDVIDSITGSKSYVSVSERLEKNENSLAEIVEKYAKNSVSSLISIFGSAG